MPIDDHDLENLRALFDTEIKRIDQVLAEREKQVAAALHSSQLAIDKTDIASERARQAANEWRAAMNDREREFTSRESHDLLESQVDYLRRAMDTGVGRRTAWVAAAGVIATMLALGIGQVLRSNLTAADVSQQIQREAPWNNDKTEVERRITLLERQDEQARVERARLAQLIAQLQRAGGK